MSIPISERTDRLQGYRGPAADVLDQFQIGVWSEVEVTNDEGSIFVGVILPRSETCDDLHLVIKLFNGYNVGVAARPHRVGPRRPATGRPSTRSPRRTSRSIRRRRTSRCSAPAAPSPAGSTTAPAR